MADVFISYHETSAGELAQQIADALDAAGIPTWCARRDLEIGALYPDEIPKQIHACRLFLIILNEYVHDSPHIEAEVGIAFSSHIPIVPLEVGPFTRKGWLEYFLFLPQSVLFPAQPNEKHLQWLVKCIAGVLNSAPPPIPHKPPIQDPSSIKIIKSGKCGDDVTYTLDENGVLTISGNGPMRNFKPSLSGVMFPPQDDGILDGILDFLFGGKWRTPQAPWWDERNKISHVEIQDGVTTIGRDAFAYCNCLTSITIPNSITKIGSHAFDMFLGGSLTSVTIPDSVKKIESFAFHCCWGLKSISVSENTKIGFFAFPDGVHIERRW